MDQTRRPTPPAFQFYPKDFLSSTQVQRMSLAEVGCYVVLLSHCWLNDGLPTDVGALARILKLPRNRFSRVWAGALSECFYAAGDRLRNKRLDEERQKQAENRQRQLENGRLGGRPRKPNGNPTETQRKPVGFADETQPEPKKSSSSSSSSASTSTRTHTEARVPVIQTHRGCAQCGRVCVPARLHQEFVSRRHHDGANDELRAWYLLVLSEWGAGGPRAHDEPGEAFSFWRARYEERWPSVSAKGAPTWLHQPQ